VVGYACVSHVSRLTMTNMTATAKSSDDTPPECQPPVPRKPLPRLAEVNDVDEVLRNVEQIIDWAIKSESHLGYFAAVYKRVTLAIRAAINDGEFDDGDRVARLDVAFAQRYFDGLNAYFHPNECQGLTLPWQVAFVGDHDEQAVILQQLMSAFTAHISFDLGMACLTIAANSLDTLQNDFYRVNAVLCSQMPDMVDVMQRLSPEMRWTRRLIPDELGLFDRILRKLRDGAWQFAVYMALHPENAAQKRAHQLAWTAALGAWYLQPPPWFTPFPVLVHEIAKHESDDVAGNIRALEAISNAPAKLDKTYL
jgi:hypothetical protein